MLLNYFGIKQLAKNLTTKIKLQIISTNLKTKKIQANIFILK